MIWKIAVVMALVVANGFFVAAEFALVKVRAAELENPASGRRKSTGLAHHMLERLDAYLSACQLGITLASLALGWVGEPMVATLLEPAFHALGLPQDNVHYFAFPIAFAVITFLHLTVGEQAPKIAAIQKARATTLLVAYPLELFYRVFRPFIWFINVSSNGMLRAVGLAGVSEHEAQVTEEEVRMILTQSAAVGNLTPREQRIMENVLDLEDKIARRYMTQRNQIVFLNRHDPMPKKLDTASQSGHSRFPLCDGDLDHVIGIVHIKDVFNAMNLEGELATLVQVARDPLFLPETIRLDSLLKEFQRRQSHLAILVDEYGGLSGMITIENVIEEMIGPIEDEFDSEKPLVVPHGPGRFEAAASCPIDEFATKCGVDVPETSDADSVGGLLNESLGRIPKVGEKVVLANALITVLEAEPTRVLRVLVEKTAPAEPSS